MIRRLVHPVHELSPFHDKGGPVKAYQTSGTDLNKLLEELNEALAA
jgi:hypothetical protein